MKLTYRYAVHGVSGGILLSNTVSGEWELASLTVGAELESPDHEVRITVLERDGDAVTLRIAYRRREAILHVSAAREEQFTDEANAYGFSYSFTVKE